MRKFILFSIVAIVVVLPFISGCGDDDDGGGDGPGGETDDIDAYFPNANGSTWVYNVTDSVGTTVTTDTINGTRELKSTTCQVFESIDSSDPDFIDRRFFVDNEVNLVTVWGIEREDNGTVTYSSTFDIPVPVVKYPPVVGNSWSLLSVTGAKPTELPFFGPFFTSDDIDMDNVDDTVDMDMTSQVMALESVTVPAGTFDDTYKFRNSAVLTLHLSTLGDRTITGYGDEWFKPYVVYVKEYFIIDFTEPLIPDIEETSELTSYNLP